MASPASAKDTAAVKIDTNKLACALPTDDGVSIFIY
jgi:hypothetical protein